jgi:hypothetical protein
LLFIALLTNISGSAFSNVFIIAAFVDFFITPSETGVSIFRAKKTSGCEMISKSDSSGMAGLLPFLSSRLI